MSLSSGDGSEICSEGAYLLWGLHWEQRVERECARQRDLRMLRPGGWRKAMHEGGKADVKPKAGTDP